MTISQRCQSCGMRIVEGGAGTGTDGSETKEWCKFCYQHGAFTQPNLTRDEMIKLSIRNMTHDLKYSDEQAEVLAKSVIPQLKRWRDGGKLVKDK